MRREPQAGKLFRETTRQEKPILWIATAVFIIGFHMEWPLGIMSLIVGIAIVASFVVNSVEDSRWKR